MIRENTTKDMGKEGFSTSIRCENRFQTGGNMLHTVAELYEVFVIIRENTTKKKGKEGLRTRDRG